MGGCCSKPDQGDFHNIDTSQPPNNQSQSESVYNLETGSDFEILESQKSVVISNIQTNNALPVSSDLEANIQADTCNQTYMQRDHQPSIQRNVQEDIQNDHLSMAATGILTENNVDESRETQLWLLFEDPERMEINMDLNERCLICLEKYDERQKMPRFLPCGHVICNECVNVKAKETQLKTVKCPQDGQIIKIMNNQRLEQGLEHQTPESRADTENAESVNTESNFDYLNTLIPFWSTTRAHRFPNRSNQVIADNLQGENLNSLDPSLWSPAWTEELLVSLQYEEAVSADLALRDETENFELGIARNPSDNVSRSNQSGSRVSFPFSIRRNLETPGYLQGYLNIDVASFGSESLTQDSIFPSQLLLSRTENNEPRSVINQNESISSSSMQTTLTPLVENVNVGSRETPFCLPFKEEEKKDGNVYLNERCLICFEDYNDKQEHPML